MEKNINKGYFVPRVQQNNKKEITIEDVLYKTEKGKNNRYTTPSKYINSNYSKGREVEKTINKNNKNMLLKFINHQVEKINNDDNFL